MNFLVLVKNAPSSKLIERLEGGAQKCKSHFSHSLEDRKHVPNSRSPLDLASNAREHDKRDYVISKEKKSKAMNEDLPFELSKGKSKSGLSQSSMLPIEALHIPVSKQKLSREADCFTLFKAFPLPKGSARSR